MRWYKRKFQICNVRENLSRKQWTAEMSMEPSRRTTERVTSNCAVSCADTAPKYVDDSICLWEEQQEEDIDTQTAPHSPTWMSEPVFPTTWRRRFSDAASSQDGCQNNEMAGELCCKTDELSLCLEHLSPSVESPRRAREHVSESNQTVQRRMNVDAYMCLNVDFQTSNTIIS